MKPVEQLLPGPLDIVGDVHGEYDALLALLDRLGYASNGSHPGGRRLVFVGDLIDRGHNSPAVVNAVMSLVDAGRAQCVLGNHELNILRNDRKHDNAWFFEPDAPPLNGAQPVKPAHQDQFRAFFETLPIALEREDLRVVHACWHAPAIADIQQASAPSTAVLYDDYRSNVVRQLESAEQKALYDDERERFGDRIRYGTGDPAEHWPEPRLLPGHAWYDELKQMGNPVSILTSGEERQARKVYAAGGKFRFVDRIAWWQDYADSQAVVIGHYWRRYRQPAVAGYRESGWDLFAGIGPHHWLGMNRRVFCTDFSVAGRSKNRNDPALLSEYRLAALRWPEATLVFDDGETLATNFRSGNEHG